MSWESRLSLALRKEAVDFLLVLFHCGVVNREAEMQSAMIGIFFTVESEVRQVYEHIV